MIPSELENASVMRNYSDQRLDFRQVRRGIKSRACRALPESPGFLRDTFVIFL